MQHYIKSHSYMTIKLYLDFLFYYYSAVCHYYWRGDDKPVFKTSEASYPNRGW